MWTGYFVSRVALKGFVKDLSRYTQAVRKHISELKILNTSSTVRNNPKKIENTIFEVETALGILQHHDAVAGTAKQKVTNDYVKSGLNTLNNFNSFYKDVIAEEILSDIGETVNASSLYFNVFWN